MLNEMKSRDFANMLADEDFFYTLLEYQQQEDVDYDSDEFIDRLEKEAFNREVVLTDLDDFDYDEFWWDLTRESVG